MLSLAIYTRTMRAVVAKKFARCKRQTGEFISNDTVFRAAARTSQTLILSASAYVYSYMYFYAMRAERKETISTRRIYLLYQGRDKNMHQSTYIYTRETQMHIWIRARNKNTHTPTNIVRTQPRATWSGRIII